MWLAGFSFSFVDHIRWNKKIFERLVSLQFKSWWRHNVKSALVVNSHLVCVRPHNPAIGFWPPSATVVSAERFCMEQGYCGVCWRKWQLTDTDLCPCGHWWDPDDVPHCRVLSPDKTEWQLISRYTLWMKTLFRGWPVMVHDMHTRRRLQFNIASAHQT